jgi:hypothetical protein
MVQLRGTRLLPLDDLLTVTREFLCAAAGAAQRAGQELQAV